MAQLQTYGGQIDRLVENFLNGNISDVFEVLGKMKRLQCAYVVVGILEDLSKDEQRSFMRCLEGRLDCYLKKEG